MSYTAASLIEGVMIQPLKQIADERGVVLHMLRCDSPIYSHFGEIYFSEINPGVTKAWKRQKIMTQHFSVPKGKIRLVIFDNRDSSKSNNTVEEIILGRPDHYNLVRIPPLLWYGFQGISETPSIVANFTDFPHNPEESENISPNHKDVPFKWQPNEI